MITAYNINKKKISTYHAIKRSEKAIHIQFHQFRMLSIEYAFM